MTSPMGVLLSLAAAPRTSSPQANLSDLNLPPSLGCHEPCQSHLQHRQCSWTSRRRTWQLVDHKVLFYLDSLTLWHTCRRDKNFHWIDNTTTPLSISALSIPWVFFAVSQFFSGVIYSRTRVYYVCFMFVTVFFFHGFRPCDMCNRGISHHAPTRVSALKCTTTLWWLTAVYINNTVVEYGICSWLYVV